MRFRAKIGLVLLAVGVLPVALLGVVSWTVSRDELQRTVGRMQTQAAGDLALFTDRLVSTSVDRLRLAVAPILSDDLSRSELSTVLAIPYRQLPFVTVLALVDGDNAPVAGPVFEERPGAGGRGPVSRADLELFARQLPRAPAEAGGAALSAPYRTGGALKLAVVLRVGPSRAVAAELVLRELEARLSELTSPTSAAYLVDAEGAPIAGAAPGSLTDEERRLSEVGSARALSWSRLLHRADGQRWLAAFAPIPRLRWGAVVAQPMAVAFSAAERLRVYTLEAAVLALVVTILVGAGLARTVTQPVARLSRSAAAIGAGHYDEVPPAPRGKDELAGLGRAFAHMAGELRRRDDEIRGWNRELQRRVDERTTELKAAQDQILRTRRLAALGSLGAGLAHELNNPMTAITGYLAILAKHCGPGEEKELIARAQEQALRVARVVEDLRAFADQERTNQGQRFPLLRPVQDALALYEDRFRAAGIALETRVAGSLPDAQGDPVQIQQVVAHLLENALNAMPSGGAVEVSLGTVDGEALRLRIADTGRGIPATIRERIFDPFFTTKEVPGRVGLGLSVSHSIVEAHHGKILVESAEGTGAAVTVLLPIATAAHLA